MQRSEFPYFISIVHVSKNQNFNMLQFVCSILSNNGLVLFMHLCWCLLMPILTLAKMNLDYPILDTRHSLVS